MFPDKHEDVAHILQDGRFAVEVRRLFEFRNPGDNGLDFGLICWTLWKVRNVGIFSNDNSNPAMCSTRIKGWIEIVRKSMDRDKRFCRNVGLRREANIAWEPGQHGWVVINLDGCVLQRSGKVVVGGLIRNE
ncbi:hypothetical protein LINPERHAP2_LOCUS29933 [Linum perenne]